MAQQKIMLCSRVHQTSPLFLVTLLKYYNFTACSRLDLLSFLCWGFPLLSYTRCLHGCVLPARAEIDNEQIKMLTSFCLNSVIYDPNCKSKCLLLWKLQILVRVIFSSSPLRLKWQEFLQSWFTLSRKRKRCSVKVSFSGAFFRQFNLHFIPMIFWYLLTVLDDLEVISLMITYYDMEICLLFLAY